MAKVIIDGVEYAPTEKPIAPEGAAEWAFYQHKQGHVISNPKHGLFRQTFHNDESAWSCICIYPDGWIIEPKPLLADAQVGDLCKRRDGSYDQITAIDNELFTPVRFAYAPNAVYLNGKYCFSGDYQHKLDVIFCEPLAPEGSAEWAWQMMLLGKDIIHCEYTHGNAKWRMTNGTAKSCLAGMSADTKEKWLQNAIGNGWQLYEEPAPLKVGDWVKYDIDTYLRVIEASGAERTWCKTLSGITVYPYTSSLSKIVRSEVKITLTLEGTVKKCKYPYDESFFMGHDNGAWNRIAYSALDPATRSLVESLLKEEK